MLLIHCSYFDVNVQAFVGYAYFVITAEKQRLKSCIQARKADYVVASNETNFDQDVDTVAALASRTELGPLRSKRSLKLPKAMGSPYLLSLHILQSTSFHSFAWFFCCPRQLSFLFVFINLILLGNAWMNRVFLCGASHTFSLINFWNTSASNAQRQLKGWCIRHDRP